MESLDQHGLLVRLIPEWAAVRNKPQRNAYHTYTVDRHLLEAAALVRRADRHASNDRTCCWSARSCTTSARGSPATTRPSAWRWSSASRHAWGSRRPTSRCSSTWCATTCCCPTPRRGATSTTRPPSPAWPAPPANRVTLHLLAALTEADSRATGPSAWGPWKAGLVADLVERTDRVLQGETEPAGPDPHPGGQPGPRWRRCARAGCRRCHSSRPRSSWPHRTAAACFSSVAGALALNGMNVRAANVSGEDGVAVEVFTVEVARGTWPDTAKLRDDLAAVLSDRMAIGERLTERERIYPLRRGSAAHVPGSDVSVDNEASETATVARGPGAGRIGLLHRITRALFEADLDVVSARVSTLGEIVVDAFYVRESDGAKVHRRGPTVRHHGRIEGANWACRPRCPR